MSPRDSTHIATDASPTWPWLSAAQFANRTDDRLPRPRRRVTSIPAGRPQLGQILAGRQQALQDQQSQLNRRRLLRRLAAEHLGVPAALAHIDEHRDRAHALILLVQRGDGLRDLEPSSS
jgi:hypothetical protein